jgi:MarR family transcriptional regulator, organic hydroperoxide resistance regulator
MQKTFRKTPTGTGRAKVPDRSKGKTRVKTTAARSNAATTRRAGGVIAPDQWLDDFLPYHLYRVTNKLNARLLKRLKTMRINTSQWRVLSVLRAYGPMSITQIVEATLMEQPTTSRVVVQLERLGHVLRRPSSVDSRVTEISITAAGLEAFGGIVPSALRHQALAFQDVSPKEMALLSEILKKVERNISHQD